MRTAGTVILIWLFCGLAIWIRDDRGFCVLEALPFVERPDALSPDYDWFALAALLIGLWGCLMLARRPTSRPEQQGMRFRTGIVLVPATIASGAQGAPPEDCKIHGTLILDGLPPRSPELKSIRVKYGFTVEGTLLLDEAECLQPRNAPSELMAVLLAGYKADGRVARLKQDSGGYHAVHFDVFGPKALGGVEELPPALAFGTCLEYRLGCGCQRDRPGLPRVGDSLVAFDHAQANLEINMLPAELARLLGAAARFQDEQEDRASRLRQAGEYLLQFHLVVIAGMLQRLFQRRLFWKEVDEPAIVTPAKDAEGELDLGPDGPRPVRLRPSFVSAPCSFEMLVESDQVVTVNVPECCSPSRRLPRFEYGSRPIIGRRGADPGSDELPDGLRVVADRGPAHDFGSPPHRLDIVSLARAEEVFLLSVVEISLIAAGVVPGL